MIIHITIYKATQRNDSKVFQIYGSLIVIEGFEFNSFYTLFLYLENIINSLPFQ